MVKIAEFTLNRQVCLIIDLAISRLERHQRHAKLDKFLTEYFLQQNLRAKIIHQQGKKAQLLLKFNLYQPNNHGLGRACDTQHLHSLNFFGCHSSIQPTMLNNSQWQAYDLHISYRLPLVAVTWSAKNRENSVGIDLAQKSDFVMGNTEWHTLQQLHFSPDVPFFQTPASRCQAWTRLEAQHKCCGLALQEYSPQRDFFFKNLSVESQFFDFKGENYCLSVCRTNFPH